MVNIILNFWLSFIAGLFQPFFAVCVLPLYPGFLSFLASEIQAKTKKNKKSGNSVLILGIMVSLGVIISMFIFGLIFTFFLQESLTKAISIVSPIAFFILLIISILLIFNFNLKLFPKVNLPIIKNPFFSAFIFGLFFGAIVLPCNPAPLAVLFAISTTTISFFNNLINFFLFGAGMAFPLLIFSLFSSQKSSKIINWIQVNQKFINIVAGSIMLTVSIYYLFFVFEVWKFLVK